MAPAHPPAKGRAPNPVFDLGPHSCYFPSDPLLIPIPRSPPVLRLLWCRSTRALGTIGAPTHRNEHGADVSVPDAIRKLSPLVGNLKPKVILEWIEVFVVMKQYQSTLDAAGCNQGVDCFPNRNAMTSQYSKIPRSLNSYRCVDYVYDLKGGEELFSFVEISVILKTLKNLRQDQVSD